MKFFGFILIIFLFSTAQAQTLEREFLLGNNASIKINNIYGRVSVFAEESKLNEDSKEDTNVSGKVFLSALNAKEGDLKIIAETKRLEIVIQPTDQKSRVDLTLKIPAHLKIKIETAGGEVRVDGAVEAAEIKTKTGTIAANVPLDDLKYEFVWTESRPRFLSDVDLEEIEEKSAGKFVLDGRLGNEDRNKKNDKELTSEEVEEPEKTQIADEEQRQKNKKKKSESKKQKSKTIKLNFTTARGIILLNVNPNEVPANLTERPLTEAAKAIIRSGDLLLTEAIRRASPKYFGEYAKTLPPRKIAPSLTENQTTQTVANSPVKRVIARVTDINNRAVGFLKKEDFEVTEKNEKREILTIEPAATSFNLVLLLDVSGSVDNYVDFIRKTARNFVITVNPNDKIAIIIFNEDVKTLSTFTTDKGKLSESLDTFDAGGGTAFYDALAYTLSETLRPLKGERTAIVVLSDGDDNRSFLAFDSLLGSIQESGALIYPLYVPSGLIASSANNNADSSVDPLRSRYMALTSKSESEGKKLAQISGGVYYPITQIGDLQKAYDDIVLQLRTAYSITFRSDIPDSRDNRASPNLKVKVKRENSFVKLEAVLAVSEDKTGSLK
jgi:VWFA-related protein